MISRFFKKKPTKKVEKKKPIKRTPVEKKEKPPAPKKILTAEGWKRMMMRKSGKKS